MAREIDYRKYLKVSLAQMSSKRIVGISIDLFYCFFFFFRVRRAAQYLTELSIQGRSRRLRHKVRTEFWFRDLPVSRFP